MKKIILIMSIILASILPVWAEECLNFEVGKLCINLKNNLNGVYSIQKIFTPKVKKNIYIINCQILTPNNILKELGSCDKTFTYTGSGVKNIILYINLEGQKEIIKKYFKFIKLSNKEYKIIQNISTKWPNLIKYLTQKYPKLENNTKWQRFATQIQNSTDNLVVLNQNSNIFDFSTFKFSIINFFNYTRNSIK